MIYGYIRVSTDGQMTENQKVFKSGQEQTVYS